MARPTNFSQAQGNVKLLDPPLGQSYERLEYFVQPDGMFATVQPQDAGPNTAIIAKNVIINDNGKFQIRRPWKRVFYDAAVIPIGIIGVTDATGTGLLLLFHEAGIKYSIDGGVNWSSATGAALGTTIVLMNTAMWGTGTLLFTTNAGTKVYTYDTTTHIYSEIAASAVAQIMTVFGGRVMTATANSTTITWSVKNNDTDWSGTGSGFEPLRLSAGLAVDDIIGLFPVNDTQMLIIRTGSVWIAELTGDVDAPFTFNFLYKVNLASARSLAYATYGVYALGLDDIYLLTVSGAEDVGNDITGGWINSDYTIYNQYQAVACYEALKDVFYVYIPFTSVDNAIQYLRGTDSGVTADQRVTDSAEDRIADYPLTNGTEVLAYHRKKKKWTYLSYNLALYSIASVNFRTPAIKGLVATTSHHQAFVEYRTDEVMPNNGNDEYDYSNTLVPVEAQLLTGTVGSQDKSHTGRIGKIEVDLMSGIITSQARSTTIRLYQTRSGPRITPAAAVTYCSKTAIVDSDGRTLQKINKSNNTAKFWQVDLRLGGCATYTLIGMYVYVERGAEAGR